MKRDGEKLERDKKRLGINCRGFEETIKVKKKLCESIEVTV